MNSIFDGEHRRPLSFVLIICNVSLLNLEIAVIPVVDAIFADIIHACVRVPLHNHNYNAKRLTFLNKFYCRDFNRCSYLRNSIKKLSRFAYKIIVKISFLFLKFYKIFIIFFICSVYILNYTVLKHDVVIKKDNIYVILRY